MAEIIPDRTINCSGLCCPEPVLETTMIIKKMEVGQVLLLSATDPSIQNDIKLWEKRSGNKIIKEEKTGNIFTYYIEKCEENRGP